MTVYNEMEDHFEKQGKKFNQIKPEEIVEWAKCIGSNKKMQKSTQLRKFYDVLRSIWVHHKAKKYDDDKPLDPEFHARLIFLRPHIANAKLPDDFKKIMELSIKHVNTKNDLFKFVKFFEAIIAYSK